jgi:predicted porin
MKKAMKEPMKKKLAIMVAALSTLACAGASAEQIVNVPAADVATGPFTQGTQFQSLYSYWGDAFGSSAMGVVPQRTFTSLYGTVDLGANYTKSGSKSEYRMVSGNALTSKFGIYGQEDLGGRWTALFRLETGFAADTGAQQDSTSLFNRASYVGMQNPDYGLLTIGRQYTTMGSAATGADPFLATAHESAYLFLAGASDLGLGANNDSLNRLNKTIRYISPRFGGGFNVDMSYSLKTDQTIGPAVHQRSAAASYASGRAYAALAYAQSWCDPAMAQSCNSTSALAPTYRTDTYLASALYDLGPFILQGAYIHFDPKAPASHTAGEYSLGLQKWWGANLLRASLVYRDTSIPDNHAYGSTLGIDHFMSKRTSLYARVGGVKNGSASSAIYNYDNGFPSPFPPQFGVTTTSVTLGINHMF